MVEEALGAQVDFLLACDFDRVNGVSAQKDQPEEVGNPLIIPERRSEGGEQRRAMQINVISMFFC